MTSGRQIDDLQPIFVMGRERLVKDLIPQHLHLISPSPGPSPSLSLNLDEMRQMRNILEFGSAKSELPNSRVLQRYDARLLFIIQDFHVI
ncbi:hypothetical protein Q8A67_018013 [Cirrhinus molitorella]|uniref:Uncharacterized protein n=1 Tax=Cirrhinus molitorella TaxID=172907 RepID=A0AA88PB87_9TELE|nr:hypothetical protein Q8A67_018013 [Cirrhinus molitorella]